MAYETDSARTAIAELLQGDIGAGNVVSAGHFAYGVFDGQPIEAMQAAAVQTSTATHRFDVRFGAFNGHQSTPARRGNKRLQTLAVTIPIWTHVATTAQETDRSTVLGAIGEQAAEAIAALSYPQNLEETDVGDPTGIVGGLLHGPNGDGFPRWSVVRADWGAQLIESQIVGSVILDATVDTDSIPNPQTINAAPFSSGALTYEWLGWDHAPLTVFTHEGNQYFRDTAADGRIVFETETSARDAEVTFYGVRTTAYVRKTGGKAYFCDINTASGGTILIGVEDGITDEAAGTKYARAQATTSAWVSGYTQTAATDAWTFGVRGYTVYLRYNGTELLRFNDIYHAFEDDAQLEGTVALRGVAGATGIARVSVDFEQADMYSTDYVDVRDLGVKRSSMTLTGSIEQGSTTLALGTSLHNVSVNDMLILEPSESRNDDGVGGVWPSTGYADAATIQALPDPGTDGFCVYDESTGDVWYWSDAGSDWDRFADSTQLYYYEKKIPKPLIARVTAVNGATITLDTAASKAATGIRVFVDAFGAVYAADDWMAAAEAGEGLRRLLQIPSSAPQVGGTANFRATDCSAIAPTNLRVHFPAGTYATWRGPLFINGWNGIRITGDGSDLVTFYAANWTGSAGVHFKDVDDSEISGIAWRNNYRLDGYGWGFQLIDVNESNVALDPDVIESNRAVVSTVMDSCDNCTADDVKSSDGWEDFTIAGASTNCHATGLRVYHSDPSQAYQDWHVQIAGSTNCSIQIDEWDSEYRLDGFEMFNSDSCEIVVTYTRNAVAAFNGSARCRMQITSGILEDGKIEDTFAAVGNPATGFIGVFNHIGAGDADDNVIADSHIVVEESTRNVRAIVAGHPFTGAQLTNCTIEHASASRYCFDSDDSSGENDWTIDGCTFVGGKVRMRLGSIANSSGPTLEYESDVTRSNNTFTTETEI